MIVPQHKKFIANNSSSRHALLTIILVYHMYDWVHGRGFSVNDFRLKYKNEGKMVEIFKLTRNITNGTRHFFPKGNRIHKLDSHPI